jgi:hypothetical protein
MSTETGSKNTKKTKKTPSKGAPTKEKPNMIQSLLPTKKQQVDSTATSMLTSVEKEDFANHSIYVNSQDTKLKSQV